MSLYLVFLATASAVNPEATRAPLPARPVERPLCLSRGWSEVVAWVAPEVGEESLATSWSLRHGLASGFEVFAAVPHEQHTKTSAVFGSTLALHYRERGNQSVVLTFLHQTPFGGELEPPHTDLSVRAAVSNGGARLTTGLGYRVRYQQTDVVFVTGELVAQASVLILRVQSELRASIERRSSFTSSLSALGGVQLNRAIGLYSGVQKTQAGAPQATFEARVAW